MSTSEPADGVVEEMRKVPATARARIARRPRPPVVAAIALGGALGAGLRYELGRAFPGSADSLPWTTLAINIGGSFTLGLLLTFVLERWPPTRYVRPFAAIGFLGSFTTFSTLAVESDLLIKDGHVATAVVYVVVSLVGGVVAAYGGIVAGRAWPALARLPIKGRRLPVSRRRLR